MATVINNPSSSPATEHTVVERTDSTAGWAVAVIILLVVIVAGAFLWVRYYRAPAAPASNGGTNINVTLPSSDNSSGSSGGTQPAPTQ